MVEFREGSIGYNDLFGWVRSVLIEGGNLEDLFGILEKMDPADSDRVKNEMIPYILSTISMDRISTLFGGVGADDFINFIHLRGITDLFENSNLDVLVRNLKVNRPDVDRFILELRNGVFSEIEGLDLSNCLMGKKSRSFFEASRFNGIHSLNLRNNKLNKKSIKSLCSNNCFYNLEELDLSCNQMFANVMDVFVDKSNFEELRVLNLGENLIGDSFIALVQSEKFLNLEGLFLEKGRLNGNGLLYFAEFSEWKFLKELRLSGSCFNVGDHNSFFQLMDENPSFEELRILGIGGVFRSSNFLIDLTCMENLGNLEYLDVSGSIGFAIADFVRFMTSSFRESLVGLNMSSCNLGMIIGSMFDLISDSFTLSNLKDLDISNNKLNDQDAYVIARMETLQGLRSLNLEYNKFSESGWRDLVNSPFVGHLFDDVRYDRYRGR